MKIGIFDPYLDTLGGGERYMMTIAECLSKHGHQVDVVWRNEKLKERIEKQFNLNLSEVKFCSTGFQVFSQGKNLFEKFKICRNYNLFIYLSDGSIPFLFSGKNIIHFQVPFHGVDGKSLLNKIKLRLINKIRLSNPNVELLGKRIIRYIEPKPDKGIYVRDEHAGAYFYVILILVILGFFIYLNFFKN